LKTIVAVLLVLALAVPGLCKAQGPVPAADASKPIKVLFLVGGYAGHDSVHLPPMLVKALQDKGKFEFNITEDHDQYRPENIKKYDVVLSYTTGGDLTKEQEAGLIGFVQNGGAFVGIHSATDSFHNSDAYWKMLGGSFIGHEHTTFKVHITGKTHPIVKGMEDFEINDETYHHKWHKDSKLIVLARRDNDGEPAAWVQYFGKGRVFVTGQGHGEPTWKNPSFQEMIYRALMWSTKRLNP
jgi:uncharacterized protein